MLFLIQMQAIEQLQKALEIVLESGKDPREKLAEAVKCHVRTVTQRHVVGALRQQELILPKKWRDEIVAQRDHYDLMFLKIIEEGIEKGVFRAMNWKMSKMAALGALNWIVRWYSPKGELSADEIGEAMTDFVLQGFGVKRNKK